ncbi:MAG: thiamine pyrophosphate-dependent enzyme [Methanomicrobiales archaeon]|nr:thiamine pyrophosphate-dependent enzyme [Methanomicrobiales archaeon]
MNLISRAPNVWCPGCGNFTIQQALKEVITQLAAEEYPVENNVLVAGIGQHGKLFDYMNLNGFYGLHGRTIPIAAGIRLANPNLQVLCVAGDGDCYAEGLDHLIFGAKRNLNVTVLVHNNRVYALTTGQYTPTSTKGYRGRSTPEGIEELPLNPLELMLVSGASFIARGYTGRREQLQGLIREAILHRGFAFVDILQVCVTYNNLTRYYNEHVYDWTKEGVEDYEKAWEKAREWDYNTDAKIGLGVLYRHRAPTFEENHPVPEPLTRDERRTFIENLLDRRV